MSLNPVSDVRFSPTWGWSFHSYLKAIRRKGFNEITPLEQPAVKNHTRFRYSPNFSLVPIPPKIFTSIKMLTNRIKSNLSLSSCIFSGGDSLSFLLYRRGKKNNYQKFTVEMCTMRSISVPISFHHCLLSLSIEISEKNPTGFETSST